MGAEAHFQVSPEIFDCVQAQAGPLKDIHSCCVFRFIVPSNQSEVLNALDWVFVRAISIFWCIELFFYSESLSPCCWKTAPQHEAATSTLYFWVGTLQVMSRADSLQTWCLELRFIRPEYYFSQSEGPLGAFLKIPSVFSCVFPEERIEFGHTAIKPRLVECCSDVCPSVDFSYLHKLSCSSTRVTIRFLVTTLNKALLLQLLSLARRPAIGRVLVVSNFF